MDVTFRFRVGGFDCIAVTDGSHDYDPSHFFSGAPDSELCSELAEAGIQTDLITTPYTFLVVYAGEHTVLVDTGAGAILPKTGRLSSSLSEAGVDSAQIDIVVITHAHPDHVGGLFGPSPAIRLPNARFFIRRLEWEFWFSDDAEKSAPPQFVGIAREALTPLESRTTLVDSDEELVPGVALRGAYGHTPGHAVVAFRSGEEKLLYAADVVLSPIHLSHPGWTADHYDLDPGQADRTKRRIADMAASEDWLVMFQHFPPFPSLGKIRKTGDAWAWVPTVAFAPG